MAGVEAARRSLVPFLIAARRTRQEIRMTHYQEMIDNTAVTNDTRVSFLHRNAYDAYKVTMAGLQIQGR